MSAAVGEEGVYLLIGQLEKGLEDPARRLAAANSIKAFCESTRLDFQEHVSSLITVGLPSFPPTLHLYAVVF